MSGTSETLNNHNYNYYYYLKAKMDEVNQDMGSFPYILESFLKKDFICILNVYIIKSFMQNTIYLSLVV